MSFDKAIPEKERKTDTMSSIYNVFEFFCFDSSFICNFYNCIVSGFSSIGSVENFCFTDSIFDRIPEYFSATMSFSSTRSSQYFLTVGQEEHLPQRLFLLPRSLARVLLNFPQLTTMP